IRLVFSPLLHILKPRTCLIFLSHTCKYILYFRSIPPRLIFLSFLSSFVTPVYACICMYVYVYIQQSCSNMGERQQSTGYMTYVRLYGRRENGRMIGSIQFSYRSQKRATRDNARITEQWP